MAAIRHLKETELEERERWRDSIYKIARGSKRGGGRGDNDVA